MHFTDTTLHHPGRRRSHLSTLIFCRQFRFLSQHFKPRNYWLHQDGWVFHPGFKWAHSITYAINWFWKLTCILRNPTLILPCNPTSITLQSINMTDWGHYLGNESFAAPSGVVEALNKERQELLSDQLPSGDDRGSPPAVTGALPYVWNRR